MAYIGNSPTNIQLGRKAVYEFTAAAGQTVFSGVDDNGLSLDLLEGQDNNVFLNGSRLVLNDDYTISGDTLTLTSAAALSDILVITTTTEVAIAHGYSKAESDSRYINYDGDIVNGDLQIVGNIDATTLNVSNNVGIGTTTPTAKLEVEAADNLTTNTSVIRAINAANTGYTEFGAYGFNTSAVDLKLGAGGYYGALVIDKDNGYVGIGTSTPQAELHVSTANSAEIRVTDTTNNIDANLFTNDTLGSVGTRGAFPFNIHTNNIYRLTIDASGNVGIAQTNPSFTLDVNGDARATRLIAGSGATGVISDELISAQATLAGQDYIRGFNYNGFNNFMAGNLSDASAYFAAFSASEEQTFLHRSDGTPKTAMVGRVAVGYNPTAPMTTLDVVGGGGVERTDAVLSLYDNSPTDADVGPAINFSFDWNGTGGYLGSGPYIKGYKENASTGDYGSGLKLATRRNGIGYAVPAMIIDSYQRVRMPYQPSFHASAANQAFTAAQTYYRVSFDAIVYHNVGSHLNPSTGVFTAPVTGTYQFNANLRFDSITGTYHLVRPYYNGGSQTGVYWINQEGGSYDSVQCSWAFYMQAGDTMEIRVMEYSDTAWSIDPQSSFSGYLVG